MMKTEVHMAQTTDKLFALVQLTTGLLLLGAVWETHKLKKENEQLKQQVKALGSPTSNPGPQRTNTRGSYG